MAANLNTPSLPENHRALSRRRLLAAAPAAAAVAALPVAASASPTALDWKALLAEMQELCSAEKNALQRMDAANSRAWSEYPDLNLRLPGVSAGFKGGWVPVWSMSPITSTFFRKFVGAGDIDHHFDSLIGRQFLKSARFPAGYFESFVAEGNAFRAAAHEKLRDWEAEQQAIDRRCGLTEASDAWEPIDQRIAVLEKLITQGPVDGIDSISAKLFVIRRMLGSDGEECEDLTKLQNDLAAITV